MDGSTEGGGQGDREIGSHAGWRGGGGGTDGDMGNVTFDSSRLSVTII